MSIVKQFKRFLMAVMSISLIALLSGCRVAVLQPKGMIASEEKELLITAVGLMLIVVIPVIILTLVIAFKYRASNTKAKYTPDWCDSHLLETCWWIVPIIIIAILAVITWITTHSLDPYRPIDTKALNIKNKPITIEVVSLEWKWLFIYPKQGIATVNYVQFPVSTPVDFLVTSDAPMNAFQIQQLAGQIYSMNGMQTKLHLIAAQTGNYYGRSVSFSGDGFSGMDFTAKVTSQTCFNKWVQKVKQSDNPLTQDGFNQQQPPHLQQNE